MKVNKGHNALRKMERSHLPTKAHQIRPALVALGGTCGLMVGAANALELGELQVHSSLGQPLRASIRYALNPTEQLLDYCISFQPGDRSSGLPTITRPNVTVVDGNIVLTGATPIMEPMLAMRVAVDCPYTAKLSREYTLLLSPPSYAREPVAAEAELPPGTPYRPASTTTNQSLNNDAQNTVAPRPENQAVNPTEDSVPFRPQPAAIEQTQVEEIQTNQPQSQPTQIERARNSNAPAVTIGADPISENGRYFVERGDSLSVIAYRIENRAVDGRTAMALIFEANKQAFIDNDWNMLKAGVWIDIPDLNAATPAIAETSETAAPTSEDLQSAEQTQQQLASTLPSAPAQAVDTNTLSEPTGTDSGAEAQDLSTGTIRDWTFVDETPNNDSPFVDDQATTSDGAQPGVDSSSLAVTPDDTQVLRPGDLLVDPQNSSTSGDSAAPTVSARTTPNGNSLSWWLMVLGGAIVALLIAFFAFGKKIRERFAAGNAPLARAAQELEDDAPTREAAVIADVDFEVDDQDQGEDTVALDADLSAGTGLSDSGNLDVAQDFGFSANDSGESDAAMDFELPAEPSENIDETQTDVIEPSHRIEDAIVTIEAPRVAMTQEAPAIGDADEYDLSMIVDATRQPLADDGTTARDLQAIPILSGSGGDDLTNQTLTSEADIAALEQDYQDEFSQTLAQNEEIARAAEELAKNMAADDTAEVTSKLDQVTDPAATAILPSSIEADNDDQIATYDYEEIGNDPAITVEVAKPSNEITADMQKPGSEITVEMPTPGNDATVEMPVKPNQHNQTDK